MDKFNERKKGVETSKENTDQQEMIALYKDALRNQQEILENEELSKAEQEQCLATIDNIRVNLALLKKYGTQAETKMSKDAPKEALTKERRGETFKSFLNQRIF